MNISSCFAQFVAHIRPSRVCELITAAALKGSNVTGDWQSTLCNVFAFLSDHAFQQPIIFGDYYIAETVRRPNHQVIVLDAVNADNNLTRKWNGDTRRRYVERIQQTYECIKRARDYERKGQMDAALDMWCRVFGEDFRWSSRS